MITAILSDSGCSQAPLGIDLKTKDKTKPICNRLFEGLFPGTPMGQISVSHRVQSRDKNCTC